MGMGGGRGVKRGPGARGRGAQSLFAPSRAPAPAASLVPGVQGLLAAACSEAKAVCSCSSWRRRRPAMPGDATAGRHSERR